MTSKVGRISADRVLDQSFRSSKGQNVGDGSLEGRVWGRVAAEVGGQVGFGGLGVRARACKEMGRGCVCVWKDQACMFT